jgi:beta-glucosidase
MAALKVTNKGRSAYETSAQALGESSNFGAMKKLKGKVVFVTAGRCRQQDRCRASYVLESGFSMLKKYFVLGFLFLISNLPLIAQPTATDPAVVEQRVQTLMATLSIGQKIDLLVGSKDMYIDGAPSIGMPRIKLSDGPTGVRVWGPATAYPAGIALAATWDPALVQEVGEALGKDARARGVHILLAPGMNIYRAPMGGRNFEYFGEDPLLASRIAVAYIRGVQSEGVVATAKHYVANDSEYDRHNVNAVVDERTLREIYLPPFEASVKEGHVAAVMDSYNLLNGEHTTQNQWLNNQVLKKEWGFDGILMSDWDATYDGLAAATAGLDLEMPNAKFMNKQMLLSAIESGKLGTETVDDKVRRMLRTFIRFGFFDRPQEDLSIPLYPQDARDVALRSARESMVLLKNDGVLPLQADKIKTIAVIGPDAHPAIPGGGGSAFTTPFIESSFLTGLSDELAGKVKVLYARGLPAADTVFKETDFTTPDGNPGLKMETYPNQKFDGIPATDIVRHVNYWKFEMWPASSPTRKSIRWSGTFVPPKTGIYLVLAAAVSHDTYRVEVDGHEVLVQRRREGQLPSAYQITLTANHPVKIAVEYVPGTSNLRMGLGIKALDDLIAPEVRQVALAADAVIVSVGFDPTTEAEGLDRSFALPWGQAALINAVAAANPKTIVNVTAGGGFETASWLKNSAALIHNWYPGQEGGRALAQILLGQYSPEGRLPISFEKQWEDNPVHNSYYPNSTAPGHELDVNFSEGLMVGYRYYTSKMRQPLFPFGFGLSYSSFELSDLGLSSSQRTAASLNKSPLTVSVEVKNSGRVAAAEVVQVYVSSKPPRSDSPERELRAFTKVRLDPGESRKVTLELGDRAFARFETTSHDWLIEPGMYQILAGFSSASTPLTANVLIGK